LQLVSSQFADDVIGNTELHECIFHMLLTFLL
jgi:hypothetical protein